MEQFITGLLGGICIGAVLMLMLIDVTDNRMRDIEHAMEERAMALAMKRKERISYWRRARKFFTWV